MDELHPGSRFRLTVRDEDKWYSRHGPGILAAMTARSREFLYGAGAGGPIGNEALYKDRLRRHNREVEKYFKDRPQDLLVIDGSHPGRVVGDDLPFPCRAGPAAALHALQQSDATPAAEQAAQELGDPGTDRRPTRQRQMIAPSEVLCSERGQGIEQQGLRHRLPQDRDHHAARRAGDPRLSGDRAERHQGPGHRAEARRDGRGSLGRRVRRLPGQSLAAGLSQDGRAPSRARSSS